MFEKFKSDRNGITDIEILKLFNPKLIFATKVIVQLISTKINKFNNNTNL